MPLKNEWVDGQAILTIADADAKQLDSPFRTGGSVSPSEFASVRDGRLSVS